MANGDILSVDINSEGWFAEIKIEGLSTGGSYDFDFSGTPKVVFTVTSEGYTSSGVLSTVQRTVYGTHYMRKRYPDSVVGTPVPWEVVDVSDVIVRIALSDQIYDDDTSITVDILSGFYTESDIPNNSASGFSVTNNSTEDYPRVLGNWTIPDREIVQDGFEVSCVTFHKSANNQNTGNMGIACVKFIVADEHSNTVTSIVTNPTAVLNSVSGLYSNEWVTTIDTTTLTDGDDLTIDFISYPHYGDGDSILNTGDGVNVYPSHLYTSKVYKMDKTHTAYGRAVAVVDAAGAGASPTVVNYTSFDSGSPPDSYATIAAAVDAIVAYNTSNFSRSNCSGGIIYLKEGNHAWTGASNTPGTTEFMIVISGYPNATRDNVKITSISGDNDVGDHVKFQNLYIDSAGGIFTDGHYDIFDTCRLHFTGTAFLYVTNSYNYIIDCDIDAGQVDLTSYATQETYHMLIKGCLFATSFNKTCMGICYIGNKHVGNTGSGTIDCRYNSTKTATISNAIIAFNQITFKSDNGISVAGTSIVSDETHGFALIQNIFERAVSGGTNNTSLFSLGAGNTSDLYNFMMWHNVFVGQRVNYAYNDVNLNGIGPAWRYSWSLYNNIFHDWNIITDIDPHDDVPDAERYGNHALVHGCGTTGCVNSDETGASGYDPFYEGIYSIAPDPGNIDLDFVLDASSGDNGTGLGGGDYHLGEESDALGIAHFLVLKYDIDGVIRASDGDPGAYATALESSASVFESKLSIGLYIGI